MLIKLQKMISGEIPEYCSVKLGGGVNSGGGVKRGGGVKFGKGSRVEVFILCTIITAAITGNEK